MYGDLSTWYGDGSKAAKLAYWGNKHQLNNYFRVPGARVLTYSVNNSTFMNQELDFNHESFGFI